MLDSFSYNAENIMLKALFIIWVLVVCPPLGFFLVFITVSGCKK